MAEVAITDRLSLDSPGAVRSAFTTGAGVTALDVTGERDKVKRLSVAEWTRAP